MEYRRLGASGLKVSKVGLGSWLTYGNAVDEANAKGCVRVAHAAGINQDSLQSSEQPVG